MDSLSLNRRIGGQNGKRTPMGSKIWSVNSKWIGNFVFGLVSRIILIGFRKV